MRDKSPGLGARSRVVEVGVLRDEDLEVGRLGSEDVGEMSVEGGVGG